MEIAKRSCETKFHFHWFKILCGCVYIVNKYIMIICAIVACWSQCRIVPLHSWRYHVSVIKSLPGWTWNVVGIPPCTDLVLPRRFARYCRIKTRSLYIFFFCKLCQLIWETASDVRSVVSLEPLIYECEFKRVA